MRVGPSHWRSASFSNPDGTAHKHHHDAVQQHCEPEHSSLKAFSSQRQLFRTVYQCQLSAYFGPVTNLHTRASRRINSSTNTKDWLSLDHKPLTPRVPEQRWTDN